MSYFIRDNATGIEFGDNAVHIAGFIEGASITNQQYSVAAGDLNGLDFPDLNGGVPKKASTSNPEAIKRGGFNRLRAPHVLGAARILNEWSANPANGVEMDWVLTLPGQYVMLNVPQYVASLAADRAAVSTLDSAGRPMANAQCPRVSTPDPATGTAPADCDFRDLPVEMSFRAYNREAFMGQAPSGTLVPGPQPPTVSVKTYLPKVANVVSFGGNSVLGQTDANVSRELGQPFGWLSARLDAQAHRSVCDWDGRQDAGSGTGKAPVGAASGAALKGSMVCSPVGGTVPVIGFAAWSRKVAANPNASYGRIVEHSYERARAPSVPTTAPNPPSGLSLSAGNAQVSASWTGVTGASRYTLYYSQSTITDLTAPGVTAVPNITGTTHTVTALTNGTRYHFVVTASNSGGQSLASSEASATPVMATGTVFRDTLNDGSQGPEMVALSTGSFSMGSPTSETGRGSDEGPVRTVTLSNRIAMGRYEVSFAEYDRFANVTAGVVLPSDSGWGRDTRPVINVNRADAQAYAAWLSTQTGKTYRLPTEAEWEYAARAGTTTRYSVGNAIACTNANYGRRSSGALADRPCNTGADDILGRTVAVGSFAANPFGLYDMHGNVREWVEDCYVNTYTGAPTDGSARTSGCGTSGILRGGSWFDEPSRLRSANRDLFFPGNRIGYVGFRLVRDINP